MCEHIKNCRKISDIVGFVKVYIFFSHIKSTFQKSFQKVLKVLRVKLEGITDLVVLFKFVEIFCNLSRALQLSYGVLIPIQLTDLSKDFQS